LAIIAAKIVDMEKDLLGPGEELAKNSRRNPRQFDSLQLLENSEESS
jgi:hypothetical protein